MRMVHVPRTATPRYPITRPVTATLRPNDPLLDFLAPARALCPQIIAGTEVSPKVRKARIPSAKDQMGRAGRSSFEASSTVDDIGAEDWIITG